MNTSLVETGVRPVRAMGLAVGKDDFIVFLDDGRRVAVPYRCYPRLAKATRRQRGHFEVHGQGRMLHWPELDEDIEVQHIVEGRMPVKLDQPIPAVAERRAEYVVSPPAASRLRNRVAKRKPRQ